MRYMADAQRGIAYPLYQRVNRELALRGWTHVELQRKSGVARSTISKWATGQQPPMPARVNAVADALGIAVGTVFMAFHASQGPWLGLPQMVQSRAQFGYRGVIVPVATRGFLPARPTGAARPTSG